MNLRLFLLLSFAALLSACLDDDDMLGDDISRSSVSCGTPGANQQGDMILVPNDGAFILVREVRNNLCPCNVTCVFAGTIDVTFELGEESVTIQRAPGPDRGLARDSLGPWLISVDTVYTDLGCPFDFAPEDICLGITFR